MLRRVVWTACVLAACSYRAPGDPLVSDGPIEDPDGPTPDPDGPEPDGPVQAVTCHVGLASATGTDRGRVGGDGGGNNFAPLACDPGLQIVGVALRMSNQDTIFGGRSAHAVLIACATVTIDSLAGPTVGALTMEEITGNGNFDWTPSTLTPVTQCQPGWIVSGLSTHTGNGANRWIDATVTCSQLSATGTVTASETLTIAGSLTEAQGADAATCNAGEILARLPNRSGAGIDSVNLACTNPVCN